MNAFLWVMIFASASAVLGCCLLLVFNRDYHAGLVGKIGLGLVALAALSRVGALLEQGAHAWVSPQGVLVWVGLALFLGRHVVRYCIRARRRGPSWYETRQARP